MRKLLIGIGVIVVLIVAAIVALPFVIPVESVKAQLVTRVKAATGRDLRIDGPVSLSVVPSLALDASNVTFANAPGAASKDMATLGRLQVKLKLLPLLSRDVEIDQLVLVDPVIALEIDKQGKPNWQFASAPPPPAANGAKPAGQAAGAPGTPSASTGAALAQLRLDDVRLVNGKITYVDHRSGEKDEVSEIAMKLSLPGLDSPFTAEGSALWKKEKVSLTLSLANPRAFEEGKTSKVFVKFTSKPVNFDFSGQAAGSTPVALDGNASLSVPSVRALAAWAATPLTMPGSGFGALAIAGTVKVAGSKVDFENASLSLDAIKGKGAVAFDGAGARPVIKGRLDLEALDLNPYLPPEPPAKPTAATGGGGAGSTAAHQATGWSEDPIDLSGLKAADADLDLSALSLKYRKIQTGSSALALHLKGGRLEADLTKLALYQGSGTGKVVADGSGAVPAIEANFNLSKVQVQPLLRDAIDLDRLSATGEMVIAVTGHGRNQREIIGTLNGKGSLNLGQGSIKGLNLVDMVKNVGSAFGAGRGAEQTDFVSLTGTYTIASGVLRNNDLQLKSAEVPMTGAGTVDLPRRMIDYKITPKVAGLVAVPVVVKGPLDNPSYEPDLGGLVEGGAKGIGGAIKGLPGDAGSVLKGILGGGKKN